MTRRSIFFVGLLLLLPALMFPGGKTESTSTETTAAAATGKYNEAPELAARVAKGELPPVDERLPDEPLVVQVPEVGVYGGELSYPCWYSYAANVWIKDSLTNFAFGTQTPEPGLAKSWEVSPDAKEFTFYLRKGHKWSDGEPFTADDIMFWWNDIMMNKTLRPVLFAWMQSGGPGNVVKLDDLTVKFSFPNPYPLFPKIMAFRGAYEFERSAAHYLKDFHIDHADKAKLESTMKKLGFDTWDKLFGIKLSTQDNPDCPTLSAWKLTQKWPENTRMRWERNAYYYKVDQAGNQLPYIDRIVSEKVESTQMAVLKVLDGQTDFMYKGMNFSDYTLLKEGEKAGGYRVLKWLQTERWVSVHVNQNHKGDPEKAELLRNKKFRYALSHAIDREEINKLFVFGMGDISQIHPLEKDDYYQPGLGQTAIEYDTAKANQLLDEIGLSKRDGSGYRTLPSGKPLTITIQNFDFETGGSRAVELYSTVADYWKAVGINAEAKQIDSSLLRERHRAGQTEMVGYTPGGVPGYSWDIDPNDYVPKNEMNWYAYEWGRWFASGAKTGDEPPDYVKDLQDLFVRFNSEPNEQKRLELGKQLIRESQNEYLWSIAVIGIPFQPTIANVKLRNVLEDGNMSWYLHHEGQTRHETLFYVDGKRK